ncbi:hypothetical protein [Clostridium kluyveri]|uniref:Uncharacterized protein n=1 Tax=Clostridium kluyveri (strain ATCC 8527 / DSM 555 / NBRC 12016 / NCIMB 10680 / K1) TaxID=431943 RepID=A5N5G6_CLOK5|nr:hypothetical protein [Clostridium kluyveri]EDK32547.1 Hypothetical protein CKL_0493 [Clostridium kluyveri DSM 555]
MEIVGSQQFRKKLNKETKKYSEVYEQFIQQLKIKGRVERQLKAPIIIINISWKGIA